MANNRTWVQYGRTLWAHTDARGKVYAKIVESPGPCYALYIGKTYYGEFIALKDAKEFQTPYEERLASAPTAETPDLPWGL